jgi:hypothetical protein
VGNTASVGGTVAVAGSLVSGITSVTAGWAGDSVRLAVRLAVGCADAPPQAASRIAAIVRSSTEIRIVSSQFVWVKAITQFYANASPLDCPGSKSN